MSDIRPSMPVSPGAVAGVGARIIGRLLRSKIVWLLVGVPLFLRITAGACTTYVPPNMVGVRQSYYGSSAGIHKQLYWPGLHFVMAGAERLHLFPHDLQLINFTATTSEASKQYRTAPSIRIQTSDGYQVQLDVTLIYALEDPYRIMTEAGPGRSFEDRLVIPRADLILRKTLGELNSEQFYQAGTRIEKSWAAHAQLRAELKQFGIRVDGVLVRKYVYDAKYQALIEGRKIKDQTVFLRQAEAKAAIEQRKRDTAVAEGKANSDVELARGRAEVAKLTAQADLYRRKQAADGKLLVELADAKGTELENVALRGAGSENMVGLKMAEALGGARILVVPTDGKDGMNPLDLPSILRKFEVR